MLATKTQQGVAPPSPRSAPGAPTSPDGRYRFALLGAPVLDKPVADVTPADIRDGLGRALTDASNALRDKRYDDATKYVEDARFLERALRRFEATGVTNARR